MSAEMESYQASQLGHSLLIRSNAEAPLMLQGMGLDKGMKTRKQGFAKG